MKLHDVLLWCDHFTDKTLPPERKFQFKQTLSAHHPSTIPNPQFVSYQQTKRREQDVWALRFTDTVTTCQLPGGMRYSKESWAYGTFLTTGDCRNFGVTLPAEWRDLPAIDPNRPTKVIREEELSPIRASIDALPKEDSSVIYKLVDATNLHEAKIPASVSFFSLFVLPLPIIICPDKFLALVSFPYCLREYYYSYEYHHWPAYRSMYAYHSLILCYLPSIRNISKPV